MYATARQAAVARSRRDWPKSHYRNIYLILQRCINHDTGESDRLFSRENGAVPRILLVPMDAKAKALHDAFHTFDTDDSGSLTVAEVAGILCRPGCAAPMTEEEARAFVHEFDTKHVFSLHLECRTIQAFGK